MHVRHFFDGRFAKIENTNANTIENVRLFTVICINCLYLLNIISYLDTENIGKMCKYCRLAKCSLVGLRSDGTGLCSKGKIDGRVIGVRRRLKPGSCSSRKMKLVAGGNIIELSPSIYCKSQTDLTILDKLQIKRRSIDSMRYHVYIRGIKHQVGVYLFNVSNCKFYFKKMNIRWQVLDIILEDFRKQSITTWFWKKSNDDQLWINSDRTFSVRKWILSCNINRWQGLWNKNKFRFINWKNFCFCR
jgi:hypothetical protein